jgi:predicted outer membrane repeat protein
MPRGPRPGAGRAAAGLALVLASFAVAASAQAASLTRGCRAGTATCAVRTEAQLRTAWASPHARRIAVLRDLFLRQCRTGDPIRESATPLTLDGHGHTLRQTCFEKRLLRQDGTGALRIQDVTLTRGGTDGPGAALTSRGVVTLVDATVKQNLSEEPGGGVFSMRGITAIRSVITGNLANDDGGGLYARRGGVKVYDSIVSGNLVDGSGGAIGSTGDILVVRSHIDGNTTDGDGGALYADEDGDVTVVDSTVDGSTADGPGGAIFTLDGDVVVVGSTLNGNRADDRGGAISGEADVTVVDSTVARNAAVAHVGGGIWARGNLSIANSTVSGNYAEGQGGGILGAGTVSLANATIVDNVAPVGANVGAAAAFSSFGSVIGPTTAIPTGAQLQPLGDACRVNNVRSYGYNVVSDGSCGLALATDARSGAAGPLGPLGAFGGLGETRLPVAGSLARDRIPKRLCGFLPFRAAYVALRQLDGVVADRLALLARDQRGSARPRGAGCDAGAAEASP